MYIGPSNIEMTPSYYKLHKTRTPFMNMKRRPNLDKSVRRNGCHLCPASTEVIVTEPMGEPVTVESGECSTEELHFVPEPIEISHNLVPNPSQDIFASPGTPSDSHSSGTYRSRSGHAVIRPACFTE